MDAGELDDDLVGALATNLRLRHAELVDAVAHDVLCDRHPARVHLLIGRRDSFQHDLQPALKIEPERRFLVSGRAGNAEVRHACDGEDDEAQQ